MKIGIIGTGNIGGADFDAAGVLRALSQASPDRSPEWRAIAKGAA